MGADIISKVLSIGLAATASLWATSIAAQQSEFWKSSIMDNWSTLAGEEPPDSYSIARFHFSVFEKYKYDRMTANYAETMQVDPEIVASLISWIVAKTGWTNSEPPRIVFLTKKEIMEMLLQRPNGPPEDVSCQALYSHNDGIIYLTKDWRCSDPRDRGTLLHELVHHLQKLNGVKARCLAEYERQAYDLQLEWLREHGVQDPYKFLDVDEFTIHIISQCRE